MRLWTAILLAAGLGGAATVGAEEPPPPPPLAGSDSTQDASAPPAAAPVQPVDRAPAATLQPPARAAGPASRCPPPPAQADPAESPQRQALLLEQRGDFDGAGKIWTRLLATATGETRIAAERRVNALAQLEMALGQLSAPKGKPDVRALERARFDLLAMAKPPQMWPFPAAAAVTLARAGLGVEQAVELGGPAWWQARARAGAAKGVQVRAERLFGGPEDESPRAAVALTDGSLVTLASVDMGAAGLKLRAWGSEASGRPRWTLTWAAGGQGGRDDVIFAATALADGTWLAGGAVQRGGEQTAWLLRGDARGKVLTDKVLSMPGRVVSLLPQADGSVWAGIEGGAAAQIAALTASGQVLWTAPLAGGRAQLIVGPKGTAIASGSVPQRVRVEGGKGSVQAVAGKDLKALQKVLARHAGLQLSSDASGASVAAKRGQLKVAGAAPWQLAPLGAKQWLLLGTVATGTGCQRDVVWLRLAEQ